jgi:hypothetical protein
MKRPAVIAVFLALVPILIWGIVKFDSLLEARFGPDSLKGPAVMVVSGVTLMILGRYLNKRKKDAP